MKNKIFLAVLATVLVCVLLISCNEIMPPESSIPPDTNSPSLPDLSFPDESININVSDGDDVSDTDVSAPTETSTPETSEPEQPDESTVPEVSTVVEKYVWYGQEEMDEWFISFKEKWENGEESLDGKHVRFYHQYGDMTIVNYITQEKFDEFIAIFSTFGGNTSTLCEYYDISREEYEEIYNAELERSGKVAVGSIPYVIYSNLDFFRYDAIFSEEFWNHPDYLLSSYVPPEIDSHYTSLENRSGYMRIYYLIDRKLIEYVGVDKFEQWLDEKEDKDQNIIQFVKDFEIDRATYDTIYAKDFLKPYNPDYLFGTPEMQEEYFTVHPLN